MLLDDTDLTHVENTFGAGCMDDFIITATKDTTVTFYPVMSTSDEAPYEKNSQKFIVSCLLSKEKEVTLTTKANIVNETYGFAIVKSKL